MASGPLLSPEEVTIREPLFLGAVIAFLLGTTGGLITGLLRGDTWSAGFDAATLVLWLVVILAVRLGHLGRSVAVAVLLYAGAFNFLLSLIEAFAAGQNDLNAAVYNNVFILSLFLGISAFLVGRTSSLIFGALILSGLIGASLLDARSRVAGNLWFEIPAVTGTALLLYQYRGALDRLLGDLKRVIAENKALRDRERLAALGEMTAGIAHEIKNPLNFVVNFAESSQELLNELEPLMNLPHPTEADLENRGFLWRELRQNLEDIRAQGLRGASTIQGMLVQARMGTGEFQAIDLNEVAGECLHLAGLGAKGTRSRQKFSAWPSPVVVRGSRGDLSRALLNLCTNAFWSVSERGRREGAGFDPLVTVTVEADETAGRVTVTDNGVGFSPQTQSQLFVPFFTTKPAGEGTGLGLALAREVVVDQHGGQLTVEGELGAGARFSVVLPLLGGAS